MTSSDALVLSGLLIALIALGVMGVVAIKAQLLLWGRAVPSEGLLNRLAHRWHASARRPELRTEQKDQSDKPSRSPEEVDALRNATRRKRMAQADAATSFRQEAATVADRLERAHGQFLAQEITLQQYERLVDEEYHVAKDRLEDAKEEEQEYGFSLVDIDQVQEDFAEADWRRRWIDDRKYQAQFAREGFSGKGKWARFTYTDHHGATSRREITMWEVRGSYVVGYDRSRSAERTFRQDRISDWICG